MLGVPEESSDNVELVDESISEDAMQIEPQEGSSLPIVADIADIKLLSAQVGLGLSNQLYANSPTTPASPVQAGDQEKDKPVIPSHVLKPQFRGPVPREGDAEELAPRPLWTPVHDGASLGHTPNLPLNKNGWRYMAAGPAAQWLPTTVYRTLEIAPECVHWSWQDRSSFMRISEDAMVVGSDNGFRSVRTNTGLRHGAWYFEIEILPPDSSSQPTLPMRDGPHARVGFARREAALNAPVGWDAYSYGIRDKNGAKVTLSRPKPFGRAFGPGDVVGLYIRLPGKDSPAPKGSEHAIHQNRVPIRFKGQLYFESLEYPTSKEMEDLMDRNRHGELGSTSEVSPSTKPTVPTKWTEREEKRPSKPHNNPQLRPLPTLADSCIGFTINGEPQGIAFQDLYDYRPLLESETSKKRDRRKASGELTTHSSVSAILRSRMNAYDDGLLGYYPTVSLYGGARARLIPSNFRYPPQPELEDELWKANALQGLPTTRKSPAPRWQPLAASWVTQQQQLVSCDTVAEHDALQYTDT
ncbi:transcription factor, contains a PHD finger motif [Malassezia yamatoensis]|uniref:Transcription factor, contains a PHD finger motif n=1 Tax=Malassezia yamatoensis TaxID=253288 RepID=A0AAJ5YRA7_9BASI|nr:transcription factor, contains a PHD finger motif [Malassezia yamatoensis]